MRINRSLSKVTTSGPTFTTAVSYIEGVSLYRLFQSEYLLVSKHLSFTFPIPTLVFLLWHPSTLNISFLSPSTSFDQTQTTTRNRLEQQRLIAGFKITTRWRIHTMAYSSYYFTFSFFLNRRALKLTVKPHCPITHKCWRTQWDTWDCRLSNSPPPASWSTWKKVLAACFSSTAGALKQNRGRKQKMHTGRPWAPAVRGCAPCWRASPLSAAGCSACFGEGCRWKTQADGKEGTASETHIHTLTHTFVLVCVFSHNRQQHRDVIRLSSCRHKTKDRGMEVRQLQF